MVADQENIFVMDDKNISKIIDSFKSYFKTAGKDSAVIGLSGGIDSAVAAKIAIEALSVSKVKAFFLPYKLSSDQSRIDAEEFADKFKLDLESIYLTDVADKYFELDRNKGMSKLRIGNFLSRLRMNILFDNAAASDSLVVGTSNKTEIILGYGTLYGDSASSVNPIGELYKFQVYELARYFDIPISIIDKKPTADLWENQTDEDELGFSYQDIDKLLYSILDERQDRKSILEKFDKKLVDEILKRVEHNSFKRNVPFICSTADANSVVVNCEVIEIENKNSKNIKNKNIDEIFRSIR